MGHIHELIDFTASAFILHPNQPKLLLLLHKKIGKWLQPGGHIELHEDPWQALKRELYEETGLTTADYKVLEPASHPNPGTGTQGSNEALPLPFYLNKHAFNEAHQHVDICYLLRANTETVQLETSGASRIAWLDRDQISALYKEDKMFLATRDICYWIFDNKL